MLKWRHCTAPKFGSVCLTVTRKLQSVQRTHASRNDSIQTLLSTAASVISSSLNPSPGRGGEDWHFRLISRMWVPRDRVETADCQNDACGKLSGCRKVTLPIKHHGVILSDEIKSPSMSGDDQTFKLATMQLPRATKPEDYSSITVNELLVSLKCIINWHINAIPASLQKATYLPKIEAEHNTTVNRRYFISSELTSSAWCDVPRLVCCHLIWINKLSVNLQLIINIKISEGRSQYPLLYDIHIASRTPLFVALAVSLSFPMTGFVFRQKRTVYSGECAVNSNWMDGWKDR